MGELRVRAFEVKDAVGREFNSWGKLRFYSQETHPARGFPVN
jgi:hypothetical protein